MGMLQIDRLHSPVGETVPENGCTHVYTAENPKPLNCLSVPFR